MNARNGSAIFLLRHGPIDKGEKKRYIGQTDYPLSKNGRSVMEAAGERLRRVRFDRIVSGALKRARDSAGIVARGRSVRVESFPELNEVSLGLWEDRTFDAIRGRYPDEYKQRGLNLADHRPPGGESFYDLQKRVLPVYEHIAGETAGNVLMVVHAGVIRVILCHALGVALENLFAFRSDYAAFSIVRYDGVKSTLLCHNCTHPPASFTGS